MLRLRKFLIWFIGTLVVLLLLLAGAALLMAPRIKGLVVQQVNDHLTTPVSVGDISFSFIRKFPYASVDFVEVKTQGVQLGNFHKPLLEAKHIYLLFNIYDVLGSELRLKKIEFQDAQLNLFTNAKGKNNFDILRPDSSAQKNHFSLELDEVDFTQMNVSVLNKITERDFALQIKKGAFNGRFNDELYDLNLKGDVFAERFRIGNVNYIDHKELQLESGLHIDNNQGLYVISSCHLKFAALTLNVSGQFRKQDEGTLMNLEVKSKEADLGQILSLIPGDYQTRQTRFTYDGMVIADMKVTGVSSVKESPIITATFSARNATVVPNGSDYTLKNISFNGQFTSRLSNAKPVASVSLHNLQADLQGQPLSANLVIEDFSNPHLQIDLKSTINLAAFSHFYLPDTIESLAGTLLVDAHVNGRSNDKSSWFSSGNITAQEGAVKIKGRAIGFEHINGRFDLEGSKLTVTDFRTSAAGSDLSFSGSFDNIFGFLLTKEEILHGKATLTSRNIDLDELLEDHKKTTEGDTIYKLDFSPRLDLAFQMQVGMITFRKFQAWQLQGGLVLSQRELTGSNLRFRAFQGNVQLDGSINAARTDSILIAADVKATRLDIKDLFTEMSNFGQAVLLDKNVNGKMTATIQFASMWSKNLHCNMDKIYIKSDLTIENGELVNFEPLMPVAKYLKGSDMKDIHFSTLHNQIEVKNQTIFIPTMDIKSSAFDISASGTHTFNNYVDYKMQLLLSQLMGHKVKEQNTEFGTIEDDGLGRTKIFLSMKGPLKDPKITWDRKAVSQKINEDIHQEKQTLKNILHREFGWFKKDSAAKAAPAKPKQEELQIEKDE